MSSVDSLGDGSVIEMPPNGEATAETAAHHIRVIAPAGPIARPSLEAGLLRLRTTWGKPVVTSQNTLERDGYLAGSDQRRAQCLHDAFSDTRASLLWCARGGYGCTRLLDHLQPELLSRAPKPIVGFSDITALLCWSLTHAKVPGIHGPVITQLADLATPDIERIKLLASGELPPILVADQPGAAVIVKGYVEGRLIAGNLETLCALIGTRYLPNLDGAILLLEEIGERPYRIDRSLTQLIQSGALHGLKGIAIGQLTGCVEPMHGSSLGMSAGEVVVERLGPLGIPMTLGFPVGHDRRRNAALPFGTQVALHAENGELICLEPLKCSASTER